MSLRHWLNLLGTVDAGSLVAVAMMLLVPTVFCLLIWYKSPLVSSVGRLLKTILLLSLFGAAVCGITVVLGVADRGAKTIFGLLFGWAYVWLLGIPVLLLSFALRVIIAFGRWIRRKVTGREPSFRPPMWGVVLLVLASLVVYPIAWCCKPNEMWQDWGERQCRAKSVAGIVYVQIREGGAIEEIRTDASAYHRFWVEPKSTDELVLNSSDVGKRRIRKIDGRWTSQYEDGTVK